MRANVIQTVPFTRVVAGTFVSYTFFVVALAMLFGGGARQGLWSDALVEWASLPLLVAALFKLDRARLHPAARWALTLLAAVFILPLLQLIPLPPNVWRHLPGREVFAATYTSAGIDLPWLALSLDPASTWAGIFSLLPPASVFLAMLLLEKSARRGLIVFLLGFVFAGVPIALLQVMGGPESPLRFYTITNLDRAVGFFANSNHNAALLYCGIPLAAVWAIFYLRSTAESRTVSLSFLSILLVSFMIGLALAHSRAGIGLGFVAALSGLLLAWRSDSGSSSRRLLLLVLVANVIAFLIIFQFGFVNIMERLEDSALIDDLRWPVAGITFRASWEYFPFGSGFGTFVPIYEMFAPLSMLRERYINHAHNDWLELWLGGGVPVLILICGFLAWFLNSAALAWMRSESVDDVLEIGFARAGSLIVTLLLFHSLVDYPLRTIALMVVFGVASGVLLMPDASRGVPNRR